MKKLPGLYVCIIAAWLCLLSTAVVPLLGAAHRAEQHNLLIGLLVIASTLFIAYFWLNGTKDIIYTLYYHLFRSKLTQLPAKAAWPRRYGVQARPEVVLVYCTYNDFNADSLRASMRQNYPWCRVVILDDSTTLCASC